MVNEELYGEDLLTLQQEKGEICVSIIVPTHRLSPERRADKPEVKRAMEKAKQLLRYKYKPEKAELLIGKMDELFKMIDFSHNTEGLGFYFSPSVSLTVKFPFTVEEKVMADNNFELRDLLYKINFGKPYYVLLLSERGAKLFEGSWQEVSEIRDKNFPLEYQDEFIYDRPSRSSSYAGQAHVKSFERDKSVMEEKRFTDFFRYADILLKDYLRDDISLILLGPEKELAWFDKISDNSKHIIQKSPGNYNYFNLKQIADAAWPAMQQHLQQERVMLVREFEEKIGEQRGVSGIQQVWEAAKEGRAFKLLVEKDYRSPGFVTANDYRLYLRPPKETHRALADAVDELIEMVIEKKGKVYFTDNDMLKDYQRIALITRY